MNVSTRNCQNLFLTQVTKGAIILIALFCCSVNFSLAEEIAEPSQEISNPEQQVSTEIQTIAPEETPSNEDSIAQEDPMVPLEEDSMSLNPEPMSSAMMTTMDANGELTSIDTLDVKKLPKVDGNTGALTYNFELTLPAGRGNSFDGLRLEYSNQNATDNDVLGYGWKLSLPYIEIINKTGIENLYSTTSAQYFYSSLSGELVRVGTGETYVTKYEDGNFLRYERKGNAWEVIDKNGTKYIFGTTTQARLDNQSNSQQIYRWVIERIEDANGNYTTFSYTKNAGTIYPYRIYYSGFSTDPGVYAIEFTLATTSAKSSYEKRFISTRNYNVSRIDVKTSGQLSRRYDLEYGDGIGEGRDLLTGITETGYDGGTNLALPKTIFSYKGSQGPSFSSSQYSNTFPEPLGQQDLGVRFGDLNGDGLADIIRYYKFADLDPSPGTTYLIRRVHINKGNGQWDLNVNWDWSDINVPFMVKIDESSNKYYDLGTRMIDVNGDGRDDLVVAYDAPTNYNDYYLQLPLKQMGVYLNTGSGFVKSNTWTNLTAFSQWHNNQYDVASKGKTLLDVNGDGLPDLITAYLNDNSGSSVQSNTTSSVMLNTGTNWASTTRSFPAPLATYPNTSNYRSFKDMGTRFADVNGDGLMDVLRGYRTDQLGNWVSYIDESNVYLNTGSGWATTTTWQIPGSYFLAMNYSGPDKGWHLVDINGDRLIDFVKSNQNNSVHDFYLNTGNGWVQRSYDLPFYLVTGGSNANNGVALLDFDGDTLTDGLNLKYTDTLNTQASGGSAYVNGADIPDQLTGIEFSHGGNINIDINGYINTNFNSYSKVGTSTMNPVVVTSVLNDPILGAPFSASYEYQKADFYYASTSLRERKFTGFGKVIEVGPVAKKTTYFHQGNLNNGSSYEADDDIYKAAKLYRTEIEDHSGNLYKVIADQWSLIDKGNGSKYSHLTRTTSLDYDGDGDHKDSSTLFTYDLSNGSIIQKQEIGEVNASADGSYTDTGTDLRKTDYTYASSSNGVVVTTSQTVKNQSNQKVVEQKYTYDGQSFGTVTKGNLTKREDWISGSTYSSSTYAYDSRGLKISERDPNGNLTTYDYGVANMFVSTTTNALNQITVTEYDLRSGNLKWIKDANGVYNSSAFDPLGRLTKVFVPANTNGTTTTKIEVTYVDTKDAASITKLSRLNSSTSTKEITYLDGFDRVIQRRSSAENNNEFVVRDRYFGSLGLLDKESLPYFGTGESRTSKTTYSPYYTNFGYDALGRVISSQNNVGTTATVYDQWIVTVTDPLSHQKKFTNDAYGRLVQVDEINGTSTYQTQYEWDAINNLTKLTDALGNLRNFTYDGKSQRTAAEDLHTSGDATFGLWQTAHDFAGNITSAINPKGQQTVYTYDALNRVKTEALSGAPSTKLTYVYDSCTNGIGRMCAVGDVNATTSYQFNSQGLVINETKTIDGTNYAKAQSYDRLGNVLVVVYPNLSENRYTYNAANKIETIKFKNNGGPLINIIKDFDYGPHGLVTYELHGNGASTTRTYDKDELYRLRSILTVASTTYGQGGGGNEFATISQDSDLAQVVQAANSSRIDVAGMATDIADGVMRRLNMVSQKLAEQTRLENTPNTFIHRPYSFDGTLPEIEINKRKPEVKIKKWGGEVSVGVSYKKELLPQSQLVGGNVMRWYSGESPVEVHGYPLADSEEIPEGGFELELLLKEKPRNNSFDFSVDGYEDLDFFFQNPTQQDILDGVIMPENVVGSYAVYHKEKRNHILGNTNYQTGKIMHIYRPKAVDAEGRETWAELSYKDGVLSVEVPREFLSTAVYPVAVDPTFGNTNWGGSAISYSSAGQIRAAQITTPANYGSFVSLSYYCTPNGGGDYATKGVIALLSNLNIVTNGVSNATPSSGASSCESYSWVTPSFSNAPVLSPNTTYVVGPVVASRKIYMRHDLYTGTEHYDSSNSYATPQNLGATTNTTRNHSIYITYNLPNYAPIAPTSLQTNSLSNPTLLNDPNPDFSAIFNDQNPGEIGTHYRLQVSTSSSFTSTIWDTGQTTLSPVVTQGNRSTAISYAGPQLTSNLTYYWRIKFWDDSNVEGLWSTSTASFSIYSATQSLPPHLKQFMFYEYDAVGNITKIVDAANYNPIGNIYEYDDLNRLTKFSTSTAQVLGNEITVGTPSTVETYTYNPLGNIVSKSGQGTYLYQGNQGSSYANPHAVTTRNGNAYTYDQNGNLLNVAGGPSYTYDHHNHLTAAGGISATTTYQYDHTGERIKKVGTQTTLYPFNEYEITGGTQTLNIYAGDQLVATADVTSTTTNLFHNARDHLNSTRVVTNDNAETVSDTKYYPFGTKYGTSGTYTQENQFIGEKYDSESQLSYLNARYYDGTRGQFTSQDPVFWEIGQSNDSVLILKNPQAQNSYSYAQNNPIVLMDPEGRLAVGIGVHGQLNSPGMYGQSSSFIVLTYSKADGFEVGWIGSSGAGGTTALGAVDYGVSGMVSNAKNLEELEGVDVSVGGSWKSGPTIGLDVGTSKQSADGRHVTSVTGNVGFGGVASPIGIPGEIHGGVSQTQVFKQANQSQLSNTWNGVKSYSQSSYNTMRNQLSYAATQLKQLKEKISNSNKK